MADQAGAHSVSDAASASGRQRKEEANGCTDRSHGK
jgi:hypothetical protein